MIRTLERIALAAVAALAPADARDALLGDLVELAAEPGGRGTAMREALWSLPALLVWRVRRAGPEPVVLGLLTAAAGAALAAGAVDALWHAVLSQVPRRAGHAMPAVWIGVDVAFTAWAGVMGAGFGARLGRVWRGGRSR